VSDRKLSVIVSSQEFEFHGIKVDEVIFNVGDDRVGLGWARHPWQKTVVDGVLSPIVHKSIGLRRHLTDSVLVGNARDKVREAFIKHWNINE